MKKTLIKKYIYIISIFSFAILFCSFFSSLLMKATNITINLTVVKFSQAFSFLGIAIAMFLGVLVEDNPLFKKRWLCSGVLCLVIGFCDFILNKGVFLNLIVGIISLVIFAILKDVVSN